MKQSRLNVLVGGILATVCGLAAPAASAQPSYVGYVLSQGRIQPESDYAVRVTVLGTAFATSTGQQGFITLYLTVNGQNVSPFGSPLSRSGNVNRSDFYGDHVITDIEADAGSELTVTGIGWAPSGQRLYTRNSADGSGFVKILRHGDALPGAQGFSGQEDVSYFVREYLTSDGRHAWLHENQALVLFELGTNNLNDSAADFQDLVLLVTLGESIEQLENEPFEPLSNYDAPMASAPMFD